VASAALSVPLTEKISLPSPRQRGPAHSATDFLRERQEESFDAGPVFVARGFETVLGAGRIGP